MQEASKYIIENKVKEFLSDDTENQNLILYLVRMLMNYIDWKLQFNKNKLHYLMMGINL